MMIKFTCPHCTNILQIPDQYVGQAGTCNHCKQVITISLPEFRAASTEPPGRVFLKGLLAVLLGMLTNYFAKVLIYVPAALMTANPEGSFQYYKPVEMITAMLGGLIAGAMAKTHGWFLGALTQSLKLLILALIFAQSFNTPPPPGASEPVSLMLYSIASAIFGGYLATRYKRVVLKILATSGAIVASFGVFGAYTLSFVMYLYFAYVGLRYVFEDGRVLFGLFWVFLFGPILSGLVILVVVSVVFFVNWFIEGMVKYYELEFREFSGNDTQSVERTEST